MMNMTLESMISRVSDFKEEVVEAQHSSMTIKEKIKDLIEELNTFSEQRKTINTLKQNKDKLIRVYIDTISQPNYLDINLINYKAIYFYFKANFIEIENKFLTFSTYNNNLQKVYKRNETKFQDAFNVDGRIYLDIKSTNFPHLIGFKQDDTDMYGSYDNSKNKEFLNNIYYETDLIHDYQNHGCDIKKIKTISWIWDTLNKPTYVFDQNGINRGKSNITTDILFVRSYKDIYHYVSLIKIKSNCKNKYVINSHHPMKKDEFFVKFDLNQKKYIFNFEKK